MNLWVRTRKGEGPEYLRMTVANTLSVVALAGKLILGQMLHDGLVLCCLLGADLRCDVVASLVKAVLGGI